jgi:formylaminopyrimidine deformylase
MHVNADSPSVIDILGQLVSFPSLNPPGAEGPAQQWIAGLLRNWKLEVDVFDVFPGRPDVVGVLKGTGGGRSLILNGHVDVVPPGDLKKWSGDPYTMRVDGERLIGRGVTDMKSGLAGFLAAIRKVQQRGVALRGDVIFESVIGEERGEPGTLRCVERGYKADFAIVGEAGEARHALAGVGTLMGRVTVESDITLHFGARRLCIQTGGGMRGANCVEKIATRIIPALAELERDWAVFKKHPLITSGMALINVFRISGGESPGFLPSRADMDIVVTYYPTDSAEAIEREIEDTLVRASALDPWLRDHPARVNWSTHDFFRFHPFEYDPTHAGVRLLSQLLKDVAGRDLQFGGRGTMCDAGTLYRAGIPVVVFGPGKMLQSHRIDEFVLQEDVEVYTEVIAEFITQWCK